MKKIFAVLIALALILTAIPMTVAMAASPAPSVDPQYVFSSFADKAYIVVKNVPEGAVVSCTVANTDVIGLGDVSDKYSGIDSSIRKSMIEVTPQSTGNATVNISILGLDGKVTMLSTNVKIIGGKPFKSVKFGKRGIGANTNAYFSNMKKAKISVKVNRGWKLYKIVATKYGDSTKSKTIKNNSVVSLGKYGTDLKVYAKNNTTGDIASRVWTVKPYVKHTITVGKMYDTTKFLVTMKMNSFGAKVTYLYEYKYNKKPSLAKREFKNAKQLAKLIGNFTDVSVKGNKISFSLLAQKSGGIEMKWVHYGRGCSVK